MGEYLILQLVILILTFHFFFTFIFILFLFYFYFFFAKELWKQNNYYAEQFAVKKPKGPVYSNDPPLELDIESYGNHIKFGKKKKKKSFFFICLF